MADAVKLGETLLARADTINSELFALTYGAFVVQLLKDERDDVVEVNRILDRIGFNIGVRIVDDFLVQSRIASCRNMKETAEMVGKAAFKLFLGVAAGVANWSHDDSAFSLVLSAKDNPLTEFVELPEKYTDLSMSILLCGAVRGALEMVQIRVECLIVKDALKGDDCTEIRVVRKKVLQESYQPDDA